MSLATKSVVFAGEDSEGEESDDDEWLDDVSETPRAGDAPEHDDAAGSFPDSPSGTPRASRGDAGSRDGDAATFAESAAVTGALDASGIPRTRLETPDGGATGDASATTRHPPSHILNPPKDVAERSGDRRAPSRRAAARVDASTRAQRRLAKTASAASELLRRKHVAGEELGATFLESAGTALQETSMSVQDISDAMRRLAGKPVGARGDRNAAVAPRAQLAEGTARRVREVQEAEAGRAGGHLERERERRTVR
jgi:hypothetical protein